MSPWELDPLHLASRLVIAVICGGLIGLEREKNNHAAGLRTHILVCLGSTLFMLLSMYGFSQFVNEEHVRMDPARLAAQVITGVGFLGAGTILHNGYKVTGLTTAASIWVAAAIGLSIGAGFHFAAVITTTLVLISLWVLNIVEKKYFSDKRVHTFTIVTAHKGGTLSQVSAMLERKGFTIRKMTMDEKKHEIEQRLCITLTMKATRPISIMQIVEELQNVDGVFSVAIENS